jgi:hypothetical protein
VRIFKNTWFTRFADKGGITNGELRELVNQLEAGQAEADLGGGGVIAANQKYRYIQNRGSNMAAKIKPVEPTVIKDKKIACEVIAQVRRKLFKELMAK